MTTQPSQQPYHRTTERVSLYAQTLEIGLLFPRLLGSVEEIVWMALEGAKIEVLDDEFSDLVRWGIVEALCQPGKPPKDYEKYLRKSALVRVLVRLSEEDPSNEDLLIQIRKMILLGKYKTRRCMPKKRALFYGFRESDWEPIYKMSKLMKKPPEDILEDVKAFLKQNLFFAKDDLEFLTNYCWEGKSASTFRSIWVIAEEKVRDTFSRIIVKMIHYFSEHDLPTALAQ